MEIIAKDIYWLAGIIEGEGSFYTYTKKNLKRPLTYPELTVQTTDYDVAYRIYKIMRAGTISRVVPYNSSKLVSYKVRLCSTKAAEWMMILYSLMGKRRQAKIREVLDVWRISVDGRKLRYKK